MIAHFKCKYTEELWINGTTKKLPTEIQKTALRKLWQLDNAETLKDLQAPPNNRLEPLKNDRLGQHSIRINNQWRICFVWENKQVKEIEIVDYH
jgi:proteic killer suppression protein